MDIRFCENALTELFEEEANAPRNLGCPYRGPKLIKLLPPECLEAVLDRVPRKELILHRAVCRKWSDLIESMCVRKGKSLMLYEGNGKHVLMNASEVFFGDLNTDNFFYVCFQTFTHDQNYDTFKQEFLPFLLRLFPRPTQLVAAISKFSSKFVQQFLAQVPQWSPHLTTLQLTYFKNSYSQKEPSLLIPLANAINSCLLLERLAISGWNSMFDEKFYSQIQPTLERIKHFYGFMNENTFAQHCFPLLGPKCTRLWGYFHSRDIKRWNPSPAWFTNLTHLHIGFESGIQSFLERFVSLRVLVLFGTAKLNSSFLNDLAPLSNLIELHLECVSFMAFVPSLSHNYPLPRVRKLKFAPLFKFDDDEPDLDAQKSFFSNLAAYFPNLERLSNLSSNLGFKSFCLDFAPLFPKLISYECAKYKDGNRIRTVRYFKDGNMIRKIRNIM